MHDWAEQQTVGLPRCLNCGAPVSVPGDHRHGDDNDPAHHFWTESEDCHPGERGTTKLRLRHTD